MKKGIKDIIMNKIEIRLPQSKLFVGLEARKEILSIRRALLLTIMETTIQKKIKEELQECLQKLIKEEIIFKKETIVIPGNTTINKIIIPSIEDIKKIIKPRQEDLITIHHIIPKNGHKGQQVNKGNIILNLSKNKKINEIENLVFPVRNEKGKYFSGYIQGTEDDLNKIELSYEKHTKGLNIRYFGGNIIPQAQFLLERFNEDSKKREELLYFFEEKIKEIMTIISQSFDTFHIPQVYKIKDHGQKSQKTKKQYINKYLK